MSKLKAALDLVPEKVEGLIEDYREELEKAWLKRDDTESLTVTFTAKFGFEKGANLCVVSIAFTPEKITDNTRFAWDDKQGKLPLIKKEEKVSIPKQHEWGKQNLVTIIAKGGVGTHDAYKCRACGATSKRFGIGGSFVRDKKFAKLEECPGEKKS
jgi:hypothetical protein